MKINIVIISAKFTIILICDTFYGNDLDYISLLSLLIITHDLTPIIYTLYFRLYYKFPFVTKLIAIATCWFVSPMSSW